MSHLPKSVELTLASASTILGIVLTTMALLVHAAILVAPGALIITLGSAWLGNAMARHGVRLFHVPSGAEENA